MNRCSERWQQSRSIHGNSTSTPSVTATTGTHYFTICLCQSHGLNSDILRWGGGMQFLLQCSTCFRDATIYRHRKSQDCLHHLTAIGTWSPSVPLPVLEPMQIDSFHLTCTEHQCRILQHFCLYCGTEGHLIIYPLSILEQQAMEEYIEEALKLNLIRPFTSPASLSFIFVSKKNRGLWLCNDYCTLNS